METLMYIVGNLTGVVLCIVAIIIGFYGLYVLVSFKNEKKSTNEFTLPANAKFIPYNKPFETLWKESGRIDGFNIDDWQHDILKNNNPDLRKICMKNIRKTGDAVISTNSFSAIEKVVEVQLLEIGAGKELWIHSEEDGDITLRMDEAKRLRDYLNSLDLK